MKWLRKCLVCSCEEIYEGKPEDEDIIRASCLPCGHQGLFTLEVIKERVHMKFRKKPVVIEAIKWTGGNWEEIVSFVNYNPCLIERLGTDFLTIKTSEGEMKADLGDWIIKGIKGEFYPCKPDIFEATYELVKE